MRILIGWANSVSTNLGVRVLGEGSRDLLAQIWPEAEFEFMNYGTRPSAVPWGVRQLWTERVTGRMGMMEWLSSFDLLWDTRSGDSFADIYGMDRHRMMSLLHEFAVQAGVQAVMAPQTVGPFRGREARLIARRNLARSRLVFARDEASAEASTRLGRPVDLIATDMVFGLRHPERIESRRDVMMNVSGLLWGPNRHVDHDVYQSAVHAIIRRLLAQGRGVTLLPHVLDSIDSDNDVPVARALRDHYEGEVGLYVPEDLDDARAAIASSQVVIGARMHACLNALSMGVPAIATAYSRKFSPLLNALDWPYVVPLSGDCDTITQAVLTAADQSGLQARARAVQHQGQELLATTRPLIAGLVS